MAGRGGSILTFPWSRDFWEEGRLGPPGQIWEPRYVHKIDLSIKIASPPPQERVNFEDFPLICTVFPHFRPWGGNQILRTRFLWTPRLFWFLLSFGDKFGESLGGSQAPLSFCVRGQILDTPTPTPENILPGVGGGG